MPAELSEDTSKEGGATKFEDIEGGGIGDGEGVKDVSEQIESEEQVSTRLLYIGKYRYLINVPCYIRTWTSLIQLQLLISWWLMHLAKIAFAVTKLQH